MDEYELAQSPVIRDVSRLVVPSVGRVAQVEGSPGTALLDASGVPVAEVSDFFSTMLASGASASSLRSYGLALLGASISCRRAGLRVVDTAGRPRRAAGGVRAGDDHRIPAGKHHGFRPNQRSRPRRCRSMRSGSCTRLSRQTKRFEAWGGPEPPVGRRRS
jgi:hypothetical protein